MTKYLAVDIETTGLNWARCGIIGVGAYSKDSKYISFTKECPEVDITYKYIFHNGSFDVKVARKAGVQLPYDHDTLLMASLLQYTTNIKQEYRNTYDETKKLEDSLKLDVLAEKDLGIRNTWKIDWKTEKPSYDEIKEHCLMDCRVTYHLFELYKERLIENKLWDYYNNLLMPLARLLVDVECTGIRLDVDKLHNLKTDYFIKLGEWETNFYIEHKEVLDIVIKHLKQDKIAKVKPGKKETTYQNRVDKINNTPMLFNPRSHIHMNKLLKLKGVALYDKEGRKTTASNLLYKYRHDPIIGSILKYKKLKKIYRDFLCKWDDLKINDILHTSFRLWATRTGRLSSAEPNLQQVPKDSNIRELFIPREGRVFTIVDAKQLEARLAAYFSKEEKLISAFKDGIDIYGQIAIDLMDLPDCEANTVKEIYPEKRQIGKQLFLATIYGQGAYALNFLLNKEYNVDISLTDCRIYKRQFNKLYPRLNQFANKLKEQVTSKGYINGWFGRKVFVPKDKDYKAINYYIQGAGSEIICYSQLNIVPKLPDGARLLLLVHDEAIYEHKPEDKDKVVDLINQYMVTYINKKYDMFMDVDIKTGESWGVK